MQSPLLPPVPYADFQFSFDPQLSNIFPQPPQLPPSSELFNEFEANKLNSFFNLLDAGFEDSLWDPELEQKSSETLPELPPLPSNASYSNPHLRTVSDSNTPRPRRNAAARSTRPAARSTSKSSSHTSSSMTPPAQFVNHSASPPVESPSTPTQARTKALLSTPQKRLNHIMSEQKRRNAIRDGYAQLIGLLAPSGNPTALGMPTRGRPKGSGARGKARKKSGKEDEGPKGKSGVLFRAVEYCRWLEEGRDALRSEVARVEAAAGLIRP